MTTNKPIRTLLIANRGEIACRIVRTARRLGIRSVAVYSDADAGAQHVKLADAAYPIGAAPARDSYLRINAVLDAAKRAGADAVHPGYGFLSENPEFAEACATAGLVFVGPPAASIRAMGDKAAAKALMEKAGIPVLPGYHGAAQDDRAFTDEATKIGYPVLIKPVAGGGGKGMHVIERSAQLADGLAAARREAKSSFGDERLLIEKYLARPRHVEVQIFADAHGNAVHLFDRDCSLQRRHQKIIEEAPATGLNDATRAAMAGAAVTAARAVGYRGAGTVEFIVDTQGGFYFLEMNTRLQVEHPVTEMITGTDLVEWQLVVASGGALPKRQEELSIAGHAIEARLYAEDPVRGFLPSVGRLLHLAFPAADQHVRVDTGAVAGDTISAYYDPLIAKLVVWDRDRPAAIARLRAALADCAVAGPTTNVNFLSALTAHADYRTGAVDTHFVERSLSTLAPPRSVSSQAILLASLATMVGHRDAAGAMARRSADPHSPWRRMSGWRGAGIAHHELRWRDSARTDDVVVRVQYAGDGFVFDVDGKQVQATGSLAADHRLVAEIAGTRVEATVVRHGADVTIIVAGVREGLRIVDPLAEAAEAAHDAGRLTAPLPGRIVAVHVVAGATIKRGAPLLVLEAMKMEHTITAPSDGTVDRVRYAVGDQVEEGVTLVDFTSAVGR